MHESDVIGDPVASGPPGPGWWFASDGRWYPPESRPQDAVAYPLRPAAALDPSASGQWWMWDHSLRRFPVWLAAVLTPLTLGLFGLIHFGRMHDRLPRVAHDDPTAGKAIGYQFIPFFNYYWIFFNSLRFTDRLNFQFRLRGRPPRVPRGLVLACCIVTVIPYYGWLVGITVMWTIAVCYLQTAVNDLVTSMTGSDATRSARGR